MRKILIVLFAGIAFFSCEKPKEIRAERLVHKWEYEEVKGLDFPGGPNDELYTTPPYPGKCEYLKDYFQFSPHGGFTSVVYGSDCLDSVRISGYWKVEDRLLRINTYDGAMLNAEILKLDVKYLILKTEINSGKYRIWKFWNGNYFYYVNGDDF